MEKGFIFGILKTEKKDGPVVKMAALAAREEILKNAVRETLNIDGDIAEAGVWEGMSAEWICQVKGGKILHLFDTFEGLPEELFEPIDTSTEFARAYLAPGAYAAELASVTIRLRNYSGIEYHKGLIFDTMQLVHDKAFCFVHLDLDLYVSTLQALEFFWPRIPPGGALVSHNYTDLPGVKKAFADYFSGFLRGWIDIEEIGQKMGRVVKSES